MAKKSRNNPLKTKGQTNNAFPTADFGAYGDLSALSSSADFDYLGSSSRTYASSGYGYGHKGQCCPSKKDDGGIDTLTAAAIIGLIGALALAINTFIQNALVPMKIVGRKKRAFNLWDKVKDGFLEGRTESYLLQ